MRLADPASYRYCPICAAPLAPKVVKEGEGPRPWCDACGFVAYSDPRVAACTITVVDGGIVLLRRANEPRRGKWVFPGGFVDLGEEGSVAAMREIWGGGRSHTGLTGILHAYFFPSHDLEVICS